MPIEEAKRRGPKLREDLIIVEQVRQGERTLVIKDPITIKYFKFGELERVLFKLLDGNTPPSKILEQFNAKCPSDAMTMEELQEFLGNIDKMQLLEKTAADRNAMLLERLKEERKSKLMSKQGSITYKRFPIIDPNKFFDRVHPYISWLWSIPSVMFMCAVILTAGGVIAYNWLEFAEGIDAVYAFAQQNPASLIWLWVAILVVIACHEFGHGLTCKHFGGEVHEIGFLLLFFNPCLYANVTDSWLFKNKYHKMYVTFAGIIVEFFVGSIFCFLWLVTSPNTAFNAICYQVLVVCGISSVLFNLNPLVKYDGYYAMSEMLELPNLKQNSGDYMEAWFRKLYTWRKQDRIEVDEEFDFTRRDRMIYLVYGGLAAVYMLSMMVGLLSMIKDPIIEYMASIGSIVYYFVGVAVFLWVCNKMVGKQISGVYEYFVDIYRYQYSTLGAAPTRVIFALLALIALAAFIFAPYPLVVEKEVTLEAADRWAVRAPVDGFLEEIHVKSGEAVREGHVMFVLADPEQRRKLDDLRSQLGTFAMQQDQALADGDFSKRSEIDAREAQAGREMSAIRDDMRKLETAAPASGVVMTVGVEELAGKYFSRGDKICEIVSLEKLYSFVDLTEEEAGEVGDLKTQSRRRPGMAENQLMADVTRARVKVTAMPDRVFDGFVAEVDPIADTAGVLRKFRTRVTVLNPDFSGGKLEEARMSGSVLRPGMTGVAKLEIMTTRPWRAVLRWLKRFFRMDLMMA